MASDITPALLACQSPDAATRSAAEEHLRQFQAQDFSGFLVALCSELSSVSKPADARRLAGLLLKNALDAKDDVRRREMHARWTALDPTLKQNIRQAVVVTLQSDVPEVRHTAAMVVAKVAAIDLIRKEWPTLITTLKQNVDASPQQPGALGARQATLEAMGYICEEMAQIKDEVLTPQEVNLILTAVVTGMGQNETNEMRLAATTALCNAIEFASHNFENDQERNVLMQVVCQGTQSSETNIRVASFECLHEIAAMYYSRLPAYITELYNISVKAIREDQEEVALQAIEFWCTVCDTECDMLDDPDPEDPCHGFIKAACPHLLPVLLEQLTKQEEGQEQDDTAWGISMASGTCLGLIAKVVRNEVVALVMPFVDANISKNTAPEDWRLREAATFAYGLILDGPEPHMLLGNARAAIAFLLTAINDPNPHVKDTTVWTLGRIFEFLHSSDIEPPLVTSESLPSILAALGKALGDAPHICYRVCCAISSLATGFQGYQGSSSPISPFFKDVVAGLLQCAQRHSNYENSKVQISAFEAINDLVRSATRDTLDIVAQLIQVVLTEIHKTFEIPAGSPEAREKLAEIQGQLCGVLQVIMQKLSEHEDTKAAVLQFADPIMETLLRIFQFRSSTVHEEAMLAVGSFSYAIGKMFVKYLPQFAPYIVTGLANYQEWQVCLSTVGVLGDICRNVEDQILPYCDDIMNLLVQNVGKEDVHRTIKPQILSSFGDVALVLGDHFEKYLETVLRVLKQAMTLSVMSATSGDSDFMDYNNQLRTGILEALSGIIQGLTQAKAEQYVMKDLPDVITFVSSIGAEPGGPDEDVAKTAVNLLGDVCSVFPQVSPLLKDSPSKDWHKLVMFCQSNPDLQEETRWGVGQIEQAIRN